jgi:crotonobetainyl-CoA:carnitine CoA-transferase CaiB-like acyl-CoA transferase
LIFAAVTASKSQAWMGKWSFNQDSKMTDQHIATSGPLAGYRILELAANIAAPLASMLLGDQGARVIKIEPKSGDQVRQAGSVRAGVQGMGTVFLNSNRNKRSIVLDLKDPTDQLIARRIASRCDVVIQNFRPGVTDRLGIGYRQIQSVREDIIYISVDGLGTSGPDANRRVYDIVIQGIAGFAGAQADPSTGEPQIVRNAIVDKATAWAIWQAATAALLHRERTGQGQHVHISMLNVALSFLWPDAMGRSTLIGDDVRHGATMASSQFVFKTKDGHLLVAAVSDAEWGAVCRAINRPELAEDIRFSSSRARSENVTDVNALLTAVLVERTSAQWIDQLRREDAIFAPINLIDAVIDDPHIRASGAVIEQQHPIVGRYRQPAHPIIFDGSPVPQPGHAPLLGEHTSEILREFGITRSDAMRSDATNKSS